METITTLRSDTLEALKDLARANIDSFKSFEEAAKAIDDLELKTMFRDIAQIRRNNVVSLRRYIQLNDEDFENHGSMRGALHRWWLNLRVTLQTENKLALVAEVERSEDAIKRAYEAILVRVSGNALSDVLHTQFREVKQHHDRIRDMRERLAAAQS
jgi:uncharacterized protein (TIGR02284 family)